MILSPNHLNWRLLWQKYRLFETNICLWGGTGTFAYKGVALNINNSVLMYENHKIVLTRNEFKIMQLLLENVGSIVSR